MSVLTWCTFSETDPRLNLAREELIFDSLSDDDSVLLMYRNRQSIIIGKHQNPWREVDVSRALSLDIPILRRISGGGAVYHDEGNFVFSFLQNRDRLDRKRNLEVIEQSLRELGIDCALKGTYDLYASERKISGNAFSFRKNRGLHHGTVLIDADLETLHGLLKREEPAIETHAVSSRPAATVNIRELDPTFDRIRFENTIVTQAAMALSASETREIDEGDFDEVKVAELAGRNEAWEWNYGRTPAFKATFAENGQVSGVKPATGSITVSVRNGEIEEIAGDAGEAWSTALGVRFERRALKIALEPELYRRYIAPSQLL